ncbi:SDR family NAD(P)-dependent oxidoreductase [Kineosporia succinea]|uniref:3-oxoacyl-[acyl-carrier protein] reductase n=1 Tax=Kineosporia succinea TaxID=84632 RepID=A0ABT9PEA3_9ACTN|nr:SDR family oxidoreductase [Kineosporia succinea]MDP9830821.1 3-oxoacyl-[acyl-carrier protein] reductase [Kineosporia succinea]
MTRRICVSGASSGIGARIAVDLARDDTDLTLLARRADRLDEVATRAREAGAASVSPVAVDLSEPGEALTTALKTATANGGFDVIVAAAGANAALSGDAPAGLAEAGGAAWAAWHWEANFRANVLTAVTLIEGLRELGGVADGASILLFSSIAAYRGSGSGSYAGTKAALHPYAYDLASALGPDGVRVNVVAPGYIAETGFFQGQMSAQRHETLAGQTLLGRAGVPEDVSGTVRWLASPASRHVTGQIIQINGGAQLGH